MNAEAVVKAEDRKRRNAYQPWACAGGPNECAHGYSEVLPCPYCDEKLIADAAARIQAEPREEEDANVAQTDVCVYAPITHAITLTGFA